jgi:NAD(P)-dependent dehydrogenase (short-subunit alcohol dehydrogenase family)
MKHLLITGGTSGLGFEFIKKFHDEYDSVTVIGRDFSKLESEKFSYKKVEINFLETSKNFDFIKGLDKVSHLVLSAGYVKPVPIKFHDSENLCDLINVNLVSQLNLYSELYSANKILEGGKCVFIGSILGPSIGMVGGLAYAAAKAGIVGACKVLALESARRNINVNVVSPGMLESPLTDNLSLSKTLLDIDRGRYPLGKTYIELSEVSSVIDFLLSDKSKAITGQNIFVERGFTLV